MEKVLEMPIRRSASRLKAPFPYFGGKSKVAGQVWEYFGDVENYVEPFCGSLAVLLGRPQNHRAKIETVNDKDFYLANFWRAVQAKPDEVAHWADWPVNECDLTARHLWLVNEGRERMASLDADPEAFDAQAAGWWLWGICSWIGSGWCSGVGPWKKGDNEIINVAKNKENGISRRLPHLGDAGRGINRQMPNLNSGRGIERLAGNGINRQMPNLGGGFSSGLGVHRLSGRGQIYEYMNELAARLRRVRVCCGDWQRVITDGALNYGSSVGVFLDPPYAESTGRDMSLYNHEDDVSAAVFAWAAANGDNPRYRIALCGYEGEHDMPGDWRKFTWTAGASYKSSRGDLTGNRQLERIWFSPGCFELPLFDQLLEITKMVAV